MGSSPINMFKINKILKNIIKYAETKGKQEQTKDPQI